MIFVLKRDGKTREPFDSSRITRCIVRASQNKDYVLKPELDISDAKMLTRKVTGDIEAEVKAIEKSFVGVEFIQEKVIARLMMDGFNNTAKAYTIYRHERSLVRRSKGLMFVMMHAAKGVVLRCPGCKKMGELDPDDANLLKKIGDGTSLMQLEVKSDGQNLGKITGEIHRALEELGFGSNVDPGKSYSVNISVREG